MPPIPEDTFDRLEEHAPTAFYVLMGIALFAALLGATGTAMLFLILGGAVHVARVGLEGRR